MWSWLFYGFALVALAAAGFFVVQVTGGSANTAYYVGSGAFAFLAALAAAVGAAFRVVDRRLQGVERGKAAEPVAAPDRRGM